MSHCLDFLICSQWSCPQEKPRLSHFFLDSLRADFCRDIPEVWFHKKLAYFWREIEAFKENGDFFTSCCLLSLHWPYVVYFVLEVESRISVYHTAATILSPFMESIPDKARLIFCYQKLRLLHVPNGHDIITLSLIPPLQVLQGHLFYHLMEFCMTTTLDIGSTPNGLCHSRCCVWLVGVDFTGSVHVNCGSVRMPTSIWSCIYLVVSQTIILRIAVRFYHRKFHFLLEKFHCLFWQTLTDLWRSRRVQKTTVFQATVSLRFCITFLSSRWIFYRNVQFQRCWFLGRSCQGESPLLEISGRCQAHFKETAIVIEACSWTLVPFHYNNDDTKALCQEISWLDDHRNHSQISINQLCVCVCVVCVCGLCMSIDELWS